MTKWKSLYKECLAIYHWLSNAMSVCLCLKLALNVVAYIAFSQRYLMYSINCEDMKSSNISYAFPRRCKIYCSCHARPPVELKNIIIFCLPNFEFLAVVFLGCEARRVRVSYLLTNEVKRCRSFILTPHLANTINWQTVTFSDCGLVTFHNKSLWAFKTRWPYFLLSVEGSHPPLWKDISSQTQATTPKPRS